MKKMYAMLGMVMVSMCAMSQSIKVQAKFAKGEYAIYESTSTVKIAMPTGESEQVTTKGEIKYEVTDARSDGYTIAITTLKWDGDNSNTDKDGKVVRIANFDEMKKQMEEMADGIVDKIFAEVDASSAPMKKENIKEVIMGELTEENMLKSAVHSSNQFSLYGKTIATGTTESHEDENHLFRPSSEECRQLHHQVFVGHQHGQRRHEKTHHRHNHQNGSRPSRHGEAEHRHAPRQRNDENRRLTHLHLQHACQRLAPRRGNDTKDQFHGL